MPTLPNMGLITPTLGADSGEWDDKLNAALELLDAHDHTSGKGAQVPVAGLNIDADLTLGGWAVTGVGYVDFSAITTPSAGAAVLFVDAADGELYWRSTGGTNIKLTNGSTINMSLVGGIVGDYASVGAEVAYDDSAKRYTFKQQGSPKPWARLASGPVRIHEHNTTEVVYVEHAAHADLSTSYTVTWPAELPASLSHMRMSASGNISFDPEDEVLALPGAAWQSNGANVSYNATVGSALAPPAATNNFVLPIPLKTGDTIKSITVTFVGNVAADADIDVFSVTRVTSAGATTSLGTTSASNVPNTTTDITIDLTDTTLAIGDVVFGRVQVSGGTGTSLEIRNTRITYTPRV